MSGFITGLDEAEAFGDVELMAEFSLLSVVQNLQQGKMGTDLLETLEVKQESQIFFSHSHVLVSTSKSRRGFTGRTNLFLPRLFYIREELLCFASFGPKCNLVNRSSHYTFFRPGVGSFHLDSLVCKIKSLVRGFQYCSYEF